MQRFDITCIEVFQISCFFNFSTPFSLQSHFVKTSRLKGRMLEFDSGSTNDSLNRRPEAVACVSCSVTDRLDFEPFRLKVQQWRKLPSDLKNQRPPGKHEIGDLQSGLKYRNLGDLQTRFKQRNIQIGSCVLAANLLAQGACLKLIYPCFLMFSFECGHLAVHGCPTGTLNIKARHIDVWYTLINRNCPPHIKVNNYHMTKQRLTYVYMYIPPRHFSC